MLGAYDETGKVRETYTYGNERITYSDGTDTWYYGYTETGSVAQLTDQTGTAVTLYSYDVFGNVTTKGAVDTGNPYAYNGEYTDAATGSQYLRARYYDPQTGSFLTEDSYLGDLMEPLTRNLYTYAENNPVNFDDPSGHGILSWAKKAASSAKNVLSKAKTAVSKAVTTVKNAASKAWNTVKTAVSNGYNTVKNWASSTSGSSKNSSTSSGSSSRSSGGSSNSGGSSSKNIFERAKDAGSSLWNWGKNKVKEAQNTVKSWSKTLEKTVQHFCTSAEYAKDTAVTFLKNVDWKKVAIGVGAAVAIAGVTVLTGGSAVPVLIGAAMGAGSGAVINGGMAALQGGSVEDIAKAASDGFMWGGIGGAFGGSSGQFLAKAATSGSKVMSNPIVQRGLEGAVDTTLETVESAARGEEVNLGTIATSFAINTAVAGDSGNTTKTVNQLMDGADEAVDEVKGNFRKKVQRNTQNSSETLRIIPGVDGTVTGGNSTKLGKNMMESMGMNRSTKWTGYQAQHIIPVEMTNHPVLQKMGMDLDDASNGIFLRVPSNDVSTMSRHRGYHSVYNEFVESQLDAVDLNQNSLALQQQVHTLQNNLKTLQQNGLPLYKGQGATVDLWQRSMNRLQ